MDPYRMPARCVSTPIIADTSARPVRKDWGGFVLCAFMGSTVAVALLLLSGLGLLVTFTLVF